MEVRCSARSRERWGANDVCGAAWKAALQDLPGRPPKAVLQRLQPRGVPGYKLPDQARSAAPCLAYPPTGEAQRAF